MRIIMNREKASRHVVVKNYVISEEKAELKREKGLIDYYIYDDLAKKDPVTIRYKKIHKG